MKHYHAKIAQRFGQLIVVLVGISLISFALMYLSPSDPAQMMLSANGTAPTDELLAQTRHEMGLDLPVYQQYLNWMGGLLTGDFGYSYHYAKSVAAVFVARLPFTVALACVSLLLLIVLAVPLGVLSATHRNKVLDKVVQLISYFSLSMPSFWLGLLLIYLFSAQLNLLPSIGYRGPESLILPAIVLSFGFLGRIVGQIRIGVLEELGKPYVTGLRARGIPERRIIMFHVAKNALIPAITLFGIAFSGMLGGSVVVETVFSLPGMGFAAVEAVTYRDYELVQAYVLFVAAAVVLVNLAVDLLYRALDPRIGLEVSHG